MSANNAIPAAAIAAAAIADARSRARTCSAILRAAYACVSRARAIRAKHPLGAS